MPPFTGEVARVIHESVSVVLSVCLRGDDGDFVVEFAVLVDGQFSTGVVHGVAMQLLQLVSAMSWAEGLV